jgi:membrane protease YdiL (CAAX protease family)
MNKWHAFKDILYPYVSFLLILLLCSVAMQAASMLLTGANALEGGILQAPLIVNLLTYSITLLYQRRYFRFDEERFFHDRRRARAVFAIAAAVLCAAAGELLVAVIYGVHLPERFPAYQKAASVSFENQNLALLILVSVILAPLAEELIFRGMLYRRIALYKGETAGILISALAFGFYHYNLVQMIFAFVLGVLFALLYRRSQTLLVPILCHAAVNALEIARDRLQIQATDVRLILFAAAAGAVSALVLLRNAQEK